MIAKAVKNEVEWESLVARVHTNIKTMYETGDGSLARAVDNALESLEHGATRSVPTVDVIVTCNSDGTYQKNFRPGNRPGADEAHLRMSVDKRNESIQIQSVKMPEEFKDIGRMTHAIYNINPNYLQ